MNTVAALLEAALQPKWMVSVSAVLMHACKQPSISADTEGRAFFLESERYVLMNGQPVRVTEEVYRFLLQDKNRARTAARRERRCLQCNYRKCCGFCSECIWQCQGILEPLDDHPDASGYALASSENVEEEVIRRDFWSSVLQMADEAIRQGALLLELRFMQEMTVYQIADQLHISRQAVEKRLKRLTAYLRVNYQFS